MTIERSHPQIDSGLTDAHRPQPGTGHLDELRRRSEQHSQAARNAIARVIAGGQPEQQLAQIRNESGQ